MSATESTHPTQSSEKPFSKWGERVKAKAAERGMTIPQLGEAIAMSRSQIYKISSGEVETKAFEQLLIAGVLQATREELFPLADIDAAKLAEARDRKRMSRS